VTTTIVSRAPQTRTNTKPSVVREKLVRILIGITGLAVLLGSWQLTSDYWVRPLWISSPWLIARRIATTLKDGTLLRNTWATSEEALIGLVIGCLGGVVIGIVLALAKPVARVVDPYLMGANSLPRVALAPFFVIWFGIGLTSKVALVVSIVLFVSLFNVRQGMESIDSDLVDVMKSMRSGRGPMLREVVVPSLLPWIMSAIKISIGMALIGAVVGEMIAADRGLGWQVSYSLTQFDMTGAMTSMVMMVVVAMILYYALGALERRVFRWKPESNAARSVSM
jgi:NitT/TauT family transport system permease protein